LQLDWRTAVYWLAGLGVVQTIVCFVQFRNSPRRHPLVNDAEAHLIEGDDQSREPVMNTLTKMKARDMLRRRSPRLIVKLASLNVASILRTIADNLYSNWIPLFLLEIHPLKFKEMGFYSDLPLLGGALGGWLNDVFIARTGNRCWSRSRVAFTGKGLAAVILMAALLTTYCNPSLFCVMLFFVELFGDWSLTTSWATVTDIGGKRPHRDLHSTIPLPE